MTVGASLLTTPFLFSRGVAGPPTGDTGLSLTTGQESWTSASDSGIVLEQPQEGGLSVNDGGVGSSLTKWQAALKDSIVPQGIANSAYQDGIQGPAAGWRLGGVDDATAFATVTGTISNPEVIIQKADQMVGDQIPATVTDFATPFIGATILAAASAKIAQAYNRNSINGTQGPMMAGLMAMGAWLLIYAGMNVVEFSLPDIMRDGLSLEALNFNFEFLVAKIGVWGFLSDIWGMISFLPFVLAGPFFQHIFMRAHTRKENFIVSKGRFYEATIGNVKKLFAKKKMSFSASAEHLAKESIQEAIAKLSDQLKAEYSLSLDFKTLKNLYKFLKVLDRSNSFDVKITASQNQSVREAGVENGTLIAKSRMKYDSSWDHLIERGFAFRSEKEPDTVVIKKNIEIVSAGSEIQEGEAKYAGQPFAKTAYVATNEDVPVDLKELKKHKNKKFKVSLSGMAKDVLPLASDSVADRPVNFQPFNVLPSKLKRLWRTHLESTAVNVNLYLEGEDGVEGLSDGDLAAISQISGQKQYAATLPKNPTIPVSHAVLEMMADGDVANCEKIITLQIEEDGSKTQSERSLKEVYELFMGDGQESDDFNKSVQNKKVKIILPNELQKVSVVFKLSDVEEVAVQVPAGSKKRLQDVIFSEDDPNAPTGLAGIPDFFSILGRTMAQSFQAGRWRAMGAFTFVGATFFSVPVNIVMNAMYGYVNPQTWVVDSGKSYFTRSLNMAFAPAIISKTGVKGYNAFAHYLPGMIFMGLLWSPAISIMNGEPDTMLAKNELVSLSGEERVEKRADHLQELLKREAVMGDHQRASILEYRLATFMATGYYRDGDMEKIRSMYEARSDDAEAQVRILAGIMHDDGFTHLAGQDAETFAFYQNEIQKHQSQIEDVLEEAGLDISQANADIWLN